MSFNPQITDPASEDSNNSQQVVLDYVSALDKETEEEKAKENNTKPIAMLYDLFETCAFAACFVLLFFGFIARPAKVVGASMENTLAENDIVIVSKVLYEPEYGDIIVLQNRVADRSDPIIKRVIATEGQWVNIIFHADRTMSVYVANSEQELAKAEPLNESNYAIYKRDALVLSDLDYPIQVPDGYVFVLGDNRNHSLDSRSDAIGFVHYRNIVGRMLFRFLPYEKFGTVAMP